MKQLVYNFCHKLNLIVLQEFKCFYYKSVVRFTKYLGSYFIIYFNNPFLNDFYNGHVVTCTIINLLAEYPCFATDNSKINLTNQNDLTKLLFRYTSLRHIPFLIHLPFRPPPSPSIHRHCIENNKY